ncbi:Transmembrane protein 145, partial [Exaiptasia diaphana]
MVISILVISLIIFIGYYVDYGKTGESKYAVQVVARVFHYVAHIVFLLLLILLAKGWTVTRGRISSSGQVKLSAFCTLYAVC